MSRQVVVRLLPDGSGRVRIHYFVHDPNGPIETPAGSVPTALGPMKLGGVKGRIACDPRLTTVSAVVRQGEIHPCVHSDDPRAATCPECLATKDYKETMALLAETVPTADAVAPGVT